jgi:hypothetical protein
MIHRGLLFWSVAAVATAIGLFTVKYKVQDLEEKIDRTNQKIIESQQATHILKSRRRSPRSSGSTPSRPCHPNSDANRHSLPPHARATTSPRRHCPVALASPRRPAAPRRPPHLILDVPPDPRRPLDRP